VNRIEIVVWTDWLPDEDEQRALRAAVASLVEPDHKAWVEIDRVREGNHA
jgi:hypothetical protein